MNDLNKLVDDLVQDTSITNVEKKVMEVSPNFYKCIKENDLLKIMQANLEDDTTDISALICGTPPYSGGFSESDFIDWKVVRLFRSVSTISKWRKIPGLYVEKTKGPE